MSVLWSPTVVSGLAGRNITLQTAVVRMLSEVDKRDAPALVALQFVGLVAAITAAVLLSAGGIVMVALIVRLVAA